MKPINLDENSLNDVPVGDTYAVRFTLDTVFDNEGQYPRRNLKFTDGGGDDRTITMWKNSAPAEIYDEDYDRGATYLITAVEYDIDEGNDGTEYQNLTVQSDAKLLEMEGPRLPRKPSKTGSPKPLTRPPTVETTVSRRSVPQMIYRTTTSTSTNSFRSEDSDPRGRTRSGRRTRPVAKSGNNSM
ncbi:hypothetical protein [Halorussus sp. AFM4]|uniref:hypothetical protein n=1 Tax=Halorussus sp. AFM4 TaxID=3421651 RepID=UPI003EBAD43C